MFEKQGWHGIVLVLLLAAVVVVMPYAALDQGQYLTLNSKTWFFIAIGLAIAHQWYVMLCWRLELHGKKLSALLGQYAFVCYAVGFSLLGIARVLAVLALAIANQGTLAGNPWLLNIVAVLLLIPALYLFYSVKKYFGFQRAFGIDHFDERYRQLPFVEQGIFRYTRNGMYQYGFLLLWALAFGFASSAALVVALFNHLYIWVHYFTTEKPDMRRIYGEKQSSN